MVGCRRVRAAAIAPASFGAASVDSHSSEELQDGYRPAHMHGLDASSAAAAGSRAMDSSPAQRSGISQGRTRRQGSDPRPAHAHDKGMELLAGKLLGSRSEVWAVQQQEQQLALPADDAIDPATQIARLAQQNRFAEACALLRKLVEEDGPDLYRVTHKTYMRSAERHASADWAFNFLKLLPKDKLARLLPTYNMALMVCAASKDIATANSILKLASEHGLTADTMLLTTYIKVCKSVGDVERAFATYIDIKRRGLALDTHVIGALVGTFSEGMLSEALAVNGRKEKFVLMERAMSVVRDAQDNGMKLSSEVWNSLMVCAGRCGQLKRAMELLDTMHLAGVRADTYTYGALMEACIESQRPELALRLFEQAMEQGHTHSVQLYTLAATACRSGRQVDWDQALQVYSRMQRSKTKPDSRFYAALINIAGLAGQLEAAFDLLADMPGEKVRPDSSVCSALISACCMQNQGPLARRVYDLCADQGVYPGVSQYNRLMDWYAADRHLGDVVYLLSGMTQKAGLTPNANTYRILINACQRADQAALAHEVWAAFKSNKVPMRQERFAHAMWYTLTKACLNMQRYILAQHNPHPAPWATSSAKWALPALREKEAQQLLQALGVKQPQKSSSLLYQNLDANAWAGLASQIYRDMITRGVKPNHYILDKMLACLRLPGSMALQYAVMNGITHSNGLPPGPASHGNAPSNGGRTAHLITDDSSMDGLGSLINQQLLQSFKYQVAFKAWALTVVEDAIARGFLPSFNVDQPCTLDLTQMPPNLAEAYVLAVMLALEQRAHRARNNAGAEGGAAGDGQLFFHRIVLQVPSFNPQLVLWPSYVPRLALKLPQEGAQAAQPVSVNGNDHSVQPVLASTSNQAQAQLQQLLHASSLQSPLHHTNGAAASDHNEHQQQHLQQQQQQHTTAQSGMYFGYMGSNDGDEDEPEECSDSDAVELLLTAARRQPSLDSSDAETQTSSTGLAVAATLRRLKFFARMQPAQGIIMLEPNEITKWVRAKSTHHRRLRGELSPAGAPQGALSQSMRLTHAAATMDQQAFGQALHSSEQPQSGSLQHVDTSSRQAGPSAGLSGGMMSPSAWRPVPLGHARQSPAEQQRNIRIGFGVPGPMSAPAFTAPTPGTVPVHATAAARSHSAPRAPTAPEFTDQEPQPAIAHTNVSACVSSSGLAGSHVNSHGNGTLNSTSLPNGDGHAAGGNEGAVGSCLGAS